MDEFIKNFKTGLIVKVEKGNIEKFLENNIIQFRYSLGRRTVPDRS